MLCEGCRRGALSVKGTIMSLINSREYRLAIHLREFHWNEITDLERSAVAICVDAAHEGEATVPFWVAARVREADAHVACCEVSHV